MTRRRCCCTQGCWNVSDAFNRADSTDIGEVLIEQSGDSDLHMAADCADEQGKFWEIHDLLFTEQEVCVQTTGAEREKQIQDIAEQAGLDMDEFNACMESEKFQEEIDNDFQDGLKAGVYGTPTFFINGRTIIGPKPLRAFEKIIDEELAK